MKKFITKETLKALAVKEKAIAILKNERGSSVLTDHAGLIIVGIILIAVIIIWGRPFLQNTLLPLLGQRIQDLFNS